MFPNSGLSERKAKATSNQTEPLVTQENTKEMLTVVDTAGTSTEATETLRSSGWSISVAAGDDGTCQCSHGPADHAFNCVSVPSTRSLAVDRELPSRVPMIENACSAAKRIFNDYSPYSRNLGSGRAHTTSLCQMPRIVRECCEDLRHHGASSFGTSG